MTLQKPRPTVVITPFFGGRGMALLRYADLVRSLGLNCRILEYTMAIGRLRAADQGMIILWRDELRAELNRIEGKKILFTFSFPSMAWPALHALEARSDVVGWVCDGGPFGQLWRCQWNYLTYQTPVANWGIRFAKTWQHWRWFGGLKYSRNSRLWMQSLATELPILSFRSSRDLLVPESAIDACFALNPKLKPSIVCIEGAGHLEGLKVGGARYRESLEQWVAAL